MRCDSAPCFDDRHRPNNVQQEQTVALNSLPALPTSMRQLLMHRRVLILQGPMGPFFARLAAFLEQHGQIVSKVNFNGGDAWFYPRGALAFDGTLEQWPAWLADVLLSRRIEAIAL